jgi:murein DD-endopeptidase MepM/ murein hydrolase activator NlpD
LTGVKTGSSQKVAWGGLVAKGKTAPNGAYHFVVRGNDGTAASLSTRLKQRRRRASHSAKVADPFGFRMYGFMFPLRGPHTYGDGIGAARSGHTHQGQDVLAKCGLPLRAARAGVVYYNDYQAGGAGNYVVINTVGTGGKSHVYMHMTARSPLKVGAHVKTGQLVGRVGTTGASSACHLHFEIWSGPGWYQGGTFLNPTPSLKAWDRYS